MDFKRVWVLIVYHDRDKQIYFVFTVEQLHKSEEINKNLTKVRKTTILTKKRSLQLRKYKELKMFV